MEKKPLHQMTEAELIAEVWSWNLDELMKYIKDFYPEVAKNIGLEDDA
jgi:hypothetical protein